jgi:hypothetical protein
VFRLGFTILTEATMIRKIVVAASVLALFMTAASAQDAKPKPEEGKKPSEILAMIESRPDFLRLIEMSWNDRGYYEIEYRTGDKAKVEINIDSKSGQPVSEE